MKNEELLVSRFSILNSQFSISRQRGLSLAELLVSIGITVLFLAVIIPSFSNFGRKNELDQGAQLIQSKIMEAKAYALAPRAGGPVGIVSYTFRAPITNALTGCPASIRSYAIIEHTTTTSTAIACESLSNVLRFQGLAKNVTFAVESQGAVTGSGSNITFTLEHTGMSSGNFKRIVVVRGTGQVTIQ